MVPTGQGPTLGNWVTQTGEGTSQYTVVDEVVASANDADYLQIPNDDGQTDICFSFSESVPAGKTVDSVTVHIRVADEVSGSDVNLFITNATDTAVWASSTVLTGLTGSFQSFTKTLTITTATGWNAGYRLRVRGRTYDNGGKTDYLKFSAVDLKICWS